MSFLKLHTKYCGVSPHPVPDHSGDAAYPVYTDRDKGGGWELVEITQAGTHFYVRFTESNRCLSVTPEGALQSRQAGTTGPWEAFYATTQPDGINLLYRRDVDGGHSLIATVLEIQS
jgi:hypothetical protein